MGHRSLKQVAACRVKNALGLAGGAGGVKDEKRVFGFHLYRRASGGNGFGFFVIPEIAAFLHVHRTTRAAHHDHLLFAGAFFQRVIGIGLERHFLAAAQAFIGRDDELGIGIHDAA